MGIYVNVTENEWRKYADQINSLSKLEFNYDVMTYHSAKDKNGWHIDHHEALLTMEAPGEPIPGGAFDRVKNAIRLYQFPDPRLISAVFDPDQELRGRNMLMQAKFAGFDFTFGVRVTEVIDEIRKNANGQSLRVWGYAYRTLKGHFEIGEIRFEVRKNLETGEIAFEINSYSKPDRIPNIFYRVGFKIFGRSLQRYFATSSMERLRKLAENRTTT